ncbi:MAG: hypothetical protein M3Y35_07430, partial [Actinomycetota bacterium]|nr:hypothetical protein [Actinomycetota bacterium]
MRGFPSANDYIAAVQSPEVVFRRPGLQTAEFVLDSTWGIPVPASGNAAVVFKATVSGSQQALRFFIREDVSSKRRYSGLSEHVGRQDLGDCVAEANWIDDAIAVNNATWPLIQMSWVEGTALDRYVQHALDNGDAAGLRPFAEQWRTLVARLQDAQFAHGDLQHANVLVAHDGAVRLVDLDGSWIGSFDGEPPPTESGHPNYQLPQRLWGRWMDTFPGLVIYGALLGLSKYPRDLAAFNNGDNLVFCRDDFRPPFDTALWRVLDGLSDPELRAVTGRIKDCCAGGREQQGSLEQKLAAPPNERSCRP